MSHILLLHVEDAVRDSRFLVVNDISEYDPRIGVINRYFYVQPPGYDEATEALFTVGGKTYLSALHMGMSEQIEDLPDGLYTLTYSVAPNDFAKTVVYHFRTISLETQLAARLMALLNNNELRYNSVGSIQVTEEEKLLIRADMIMTGIRNTRIINELQYNQLYKQYQEVQNILGLIQEFHV